MSEKNYYAILGVSKDADEKEIKKAFRKLAKKYHPDTNEGNASYEQKFKDINEAYAILGDEKKRKLYDKYGEIAFQEGFDPEAYEAAKQAGRFHSSSYGPQGFYYSSGGPQGNFGQGTDIDDILQGLFGGAGRSSADPFGHGSVDPFGHGSADPFGQNFGRSRSRKGRNLESEISVSFDEAAFGCDRTLHLSDAAGNATSLEVHIPAGIDEGQKVRLKGKGHPGTGGAPNGDLFLKVHIQPRNGFTRQGSDVYVDAKIPFTTAALGGEAVVPTLHGNVSVKIPAGTQAGTKIRLKGKGIVSMKRKDHYGDEYVVVQITVPRHLTEEQKRKLREFAAA